MKNFGKLMREFRIEQEMGLREFCVETHFQPCDWGMVERGLMRPPSDLSAIIACLNLNDQQIEMLKESSERFSFEKSLSDDEIVRDKLPWNWWLAVSKNDNLKEVSDEEFKTILQSEQEKWLNFLRPYHVIQDREPELWSKNALDVKN